jgi:hypothetical protein
MTDHALPYLHPVAGGAVLLLLAYAGSLGLRLRTARRGRERLAARHARLAPWAYGLVLASWLGGLLSALWLRADLEPLASLHFRLGTLMAVLLGGSALTARLMQRRLPILRAWHPWLGAGALLLAAAHVVTGLRLIP